MNLRQLISSVVVMAATGLLLAGCGSGERAPAGPTGPSATNRGSSAVKISDFKFAPATLTAEHGASVTVSNDDSTAHSATADDGHSFDTGALDPGASKSISVTRPGRYPYHCTFHAFMHGTLVVK